MNVCFDRSQVSLASHACLSKPVLLWVDWVPRIQIIVQSQVAKVDKLATVLKSSCLVKVSFSSGAMESFHLGISGREVHLLSLLCFCGAHGFGVHP